MVSQSFDQESAEMTPVNQDKMFSASFQLNRGDSFATFASQNIKLRMTSEQAGSNQEEPLEFITVPPSDTPTHSVKPPPSPIMFQDKTDSESPVVEYFEMPKITNIDHHRFSFFTQNLKIQENSSRLNLLVSARRQETHSPSRQEDRSQRSQQVDVQTLQTQEQEDLEDSKQISAAKGRPQISEIEVMELTKQFNSLIDVYRPRIDRIFNVKKTKIAAFEKEARNKKDVVKEIEEEQFANSYSMASIIESQLEKHRKLAGGRVDAAKQDEHLSENEDEEKVENRIWVETKILSFHSTKFHVKVHGKLCTNYTQRSFSRFTLLSSIRQIAIWINEWVWFERAILTIIILNAILFGAKDYSYVAKETSEEPIINQICNKTVIVVAIVYVSEMIIKLLALGLLNDKNTYLRDWWNLFDLLMVIASIFALYPEFVNLSIIRTFKIYRFFMLQQKLPTLRNLIKTLVKTLPQLFHLSVLLFVCQLFYATVGLQIWSGQSHYRCRQTLHPVDGDWKIVEDDFRVCGGIHLCNETLGHACGSLFDPAIRQDLNLTDDQLYRDSAHENLNFGLTNFDNVVKAYITVFQASTLEGWMQILQFSIDGDNQIIASIYFIALVIVIHFLVLNMPIGIIVVNCQELHDQENHKLFLQIEECDRIIKDVQAELQLTDFEEKKGNKCTYYCGKGMNFLLAYKAAPEPNAKRYDYLFFRLIWRFVHQPALKIIFYLLAILNLVFISIQTSNVQFQGTPEKSPFDHYHEILLAINFLFLLEYILKLLAFTFKQNFTNSVTVVDLAVTVTYFVVFAIDCSFNGQFSFGGPELKWTNRLVFLNCLRTIKVFEFLRLNSKFKVIIETIISSLKQTPEYLVIMLIFIYVFAVLGLQAFACKLTDSSSGAGTPRMNFDNLLLAILSVVEILLGEKWNVLFYDCQKSRGIVTAVIYFFPLVTIGLSVMLNLFLVLLLGNYQRQILLSQLQIQQQKLAKVGGNFQIASKVPTLNPILIGEEEINGIYGYAEGLPPRIFDGQKGYDGVKMFQSKPKRRGDVSALQIRSAMRATSSEIITITEEGISDDPNSHRNLIKLERMQIASPMFNNPSNHSVQKQPKNDQYDSSLEMEEYIQKYNDFKKKEREEIVTKIRDHISLKDNQSSPLQRSDMPLPFASLAADKDYQPREPKTALLRPRIESTLFAETNQDKLNNSARNDENKAGQRRVEIIGGNLFVQDSQSKLGQIAQIISKGVASLKINQVTPSGVKQNASANPKSKGVYQLLFNNFSWRALKEFLGKSSLFILHKNSSLRKMLIRIAVGGEKVRTFKTIADLMQFYSQDAAELRREYLHQKKINYVPNQEEQNSEEIIENLFHYKDSAAIPSTALNNSQAIDEIQSLQRDKNFNLTKLEEQAVLINKILDQKKHKNFYNNPSQKQKGVFYLDEKRDINIQWNKWYHFTFHQFGYFFVQLCVIISIFVLILDNPLDDPNSLEQIVLRCVDLAVTFVFFIEAIIKILALGFFTTSLKGGNQRAYVQNFWNVLDFAVLITTIFQIYYEKAYIQKLLDTSQEVQEGMQNIRDVSMLRVLRTIRILRPLRMSSQFLGLKLAMNTIISSAVQIFNVTVLSFLGLALFAILGKSMFTQCFYQCLINGDHQLARTDPTIDTKQDCLDQGYEWKNAQQNFDDMPQALWTLFVLFTSTSGGWLEALYDGIDARGFDQQPKRNNNPWLGLYFVIFMITSKMLMFNLFVGIVFEKYSRFQDRITSFQSANSQQRAWIDVQRQLMRINLRKKLFDSQNACVVLARKVSENKYFAIFVMTCIVLNSVVLAIPYLGMSSQFSDILNSIVIAFTVVYNIEAAIKIIGLGKHYFYSRWNQFDFAIVLLADIIYLVENLLVNVSLSKFVVVMRALRALRVIRVLKEHRQAMISVNAVMAIIGFFINILIVLFIILIIFSVLGMEVFKSVMLQDQYNDSYNFRSFGSSFLLLIGCLTGQNWNVFVEELSLQGSYNGVQCVNGQTYNDWQTAGVIGCGFSNAYWFFFFYIIITRFLIVNLMTGFVIYGFINANRENQGIIKPEDIDLFIKLWADYDQKATGWIEVVDVVFLIYELPAPLGKADDYKEQQQQSFAQLEDEKRVSNVLPNKTRFVVKKERNMVLPAKITIQEMNNLNVKIYNDPNGGVKCHFRDICIALMTRALNKAGNPKHQDQFEKVTSAAFLSHFGNLQENAVIKNETAGSYLAGIFLGRLIKGVFQRKNRHRVNQVPSIGVYNAKAEYSRKLRELEITRAQQKREKQNQEQKRLRSSSISKFETEMGLIDKTQLPIAVQEERVSSPLLQKKVMFSKNQSQNLSQSGSPGKKSIRNESKLFVPEKLKDTERSSWWLPETHFGSTNAKIQNWIAQQDFCHGHHEDDNEDSKLPARKRQDINEKDDDDEDKSNIDQSVYVEEFNDPSFKQAESPPMRKTYTFETEEQSQLKNYVKDESEKDDFIKQSTLFKTKILLNKAVLPQTEKIEEMKEGSDTNSFNTDSSISIY